MVKIMRQDRIAQKVQFSSNVLVRRQTPDIWNVMAVSTLVDSYVDSAAREAGAPTEQAAVKKISQYLLLSQSYNFQPIAVENTGVINSFAVDSLYALGRRISSSGGEEREFPSLSTHL